MYHKFVIALFFSIMHVTSWISRSSSRFYSGICFVGVCNNVYIPILKTTSQWATVPQPADVPSVSTSTIVAVNRTVKSTLSKKGVARATIDIYIQEQVGHRQVRCSLWHIFSSKKVQQSFMHWHKIANIFPLNLIKYGVFAKIYPHKIISLYGSPVPVIVHLKYPYQ